MRQWDATRRSITVNPAAMCSSISLPHEAVIWQKPRNGGFGQDFATGYNQTRKAHFSKSDGYGNR
jgi:hypothetical protein